MGEGGRERAGEEKERVIRGDRAAAAAAAETSGCQSIRRERGCEGGRDSGSV